MMKLLLRIIVITALFVITKNADAATTITTSMVATTTATNTNDPEEIGTEEFGRRSPTRRIVCSIDASYGIQFLGQSTPDFILYEIYTSEDYCIYSCIEEMDFIDYMFSNSGEFQIHLLSEECRYIGYVSL